MEPDDKRLARETVKDIAKVLGKAYWNHSVRSNARKIPILPNEDDISYSNRCYRIEQANKPWYGYKLHTLGIYFKDWLIITFSVAILVISIISVMFALGMH